MTDGADRAKPSAAVSVLIPTFGQAAFVRRALDSLVRQSFRDWEAHIVIDGVIDDTPALVEPYRDDLRITITALEWNAGFGAALNVALAATTAPLVAYLPTDDVWHADHLATALATLDANPHAALAYAGIR